MKNIKGISDISGFGKNTPYEEACQNMLQAGWEWLNKNKESELKTRSYKNIYGIMKLDSPDAKKLSEAIVKAVDDCTGAMHQTVMGHLIYIHNNGIEKWKSELKT